MLLSECLGISATQLWRYGVFDSYLGIDSLLHVDPARLRTTRVPELRGSYRRFQQYFEDTLRLIAAAKTGDALERQAIKRLVFPEVAEASLGYAKGSNRGRGVNLRVATSLYTTAKTIVEAGIQDPTIFELAVLFEEGFGADLISDMTVYILLDELSTFNKRISDTLGLKTCRVRTRGKTATYVLGRKQLEPILLIPNSILADLPLASDWSEIDKVSRYNDTLRRRLNKLVQKTWGQSASRIPKWQIKEIFLRHPSLLKELIANYSRAKAEPYDFEADPRGIVTWPRISRDFANDNPLKLPTVNSTAGIYRILETICKHFKHLVEERGLRELLFDAEGKPKIERASQLLFFGIADAYCVSNNIDISREPETGRGPADFKLSKGHRERVIVEVKLSSNAKYLDGLVSQLPTYLNAESANAGLFLLIKVGDHDARIKTICSEHARLIANGNLLPDLVIVDALKKPSASKTKRIRLSE